MATATETETGVTTLRRSTLESLGLGTVLEIFRRGRLPITRGEAVERVFGPEEDRGALVISGANGIVGAGKTLQLGSRLEAHGVPVVALDLPDAPDGIGPKVPGLIRAFGKERADEILENIVRLTYDGETLPDALDEFRPRFLLEAIPEILELKKAHYELFRGRYPDLEIRSVTSGFPAEELGVGIAHPAFPHEINKVWETVEAGDSDVRELLWSLGLIPIPVSDDWSFVLDVLFCGMTLAALRYHRESSMPYWKIDKLVRRDLGPNPFRAHDAIGAKGANFLTWSCLHHLSQEYGPLFEPTSDLVERKESGQDWYPPNYFRPLVDWTLEPSEEEEMRVWTHGPVLQMTSLMLREERAHLSHLNILGELCAQLRNGVLAKMRRLGQERCRELVVAYQERHPEAKESPWHPETLERMETPEWEQLYVNAEHDGTVGVVTLGRESYNWDVDAELNRALDWLRAEGIERVILTGDFHLATQLVGADTAEFFPALEDEEEGRRVSEAWTETARRFYDEFAVSVGFVHGKRCLGGMLELMLHCHYLVAVEGTRLGFPEVTLPVVPGMEGCHWPFRKADTSHWPRLLDLLLSGRSVPAEDGEGWLVDRAAPLDVALPTAWTLATGGDHDLERRSVEERAPGVEALPAFSEVGRDETDRARRAIYDTVRDALEVPLPEALERQSRRSAGFMVSEACRGGTVGKARRKTMEV